MTGRDDGTIGRRGPGAAVAALTAAISLLGAAGVVALLRVGHVALADVNLLSGPVPLTLHALAVSAFLLVVARRERRWLCVTLPVLLVTTIGAVGGAAVALHATRTVTDHYPPSFAVWTGAVVFCAAACPIVTRRRGAVRRAAAVLAIPLTASSAFAAINQHYGYWPDAAALVGQTRQLSEAALRERLAAAEAAPTTHGVLATFDPPATASQFPHRPGSVYLPPAFASVPPGTLPVLVMLGGTPGSPAAWPQAGSAVRTADAYAAAHHGVAPILVFVDHNGSALGDTECVDGPRGRAETYLTTDVPASVIATFHPALAPSAWGVMGFSEGGTCAVHLALRHPDVFGRFVALAPDRAPIVGTPRHTLQRLFGGSAEAMADHDPISLMGRHSYASTIGWFVTGSRDARHKQSTRHLSAAASRSGMKAYLWVINGEHNWQFATRAFRDVLPDVARELRCPLDAHAPSPD